MAVTPTVPTAVFQDPTGAILRGLGIAIHRIGYRQLIIAVPRFAEDTSQSLSKELYPYVAQHLGITDWRAVEHSIRVVILDAWNRKDPESWQVYFPNSQKVPSNKQFIATLAEWIK